MGGQLWVFIGPVCGRLVHVRALRSSNHCGWSLALCVVDWSL